MCACGHSFATQPSTEPAAIVRAITVIMGAVVGLTFLFGFGNVLNLALRLGVPVWVAPLVAPAVDLSILGLLLGTRHLALAGASADVLRPARRLLIFASVGTLALNVADPLVAGEFGKAAFDAVGPLLLIGWAEVGPGFLQAVSTSIAETGSQELSANAQSEVSACTTSGDADRPRQSQVGAAVEAPRRDQKAPRRRAPEALLEQARQEDAAHRAAHQKPISANTLRIRLGIGATQARRFVKIIRAEFQAQVSRDPVEDGVAHEVHDAAATLAA